MSLLLAAPQAARWQCGYANQLAIPVLHYIPAHRLDECNQTGLHGAFSPFQRLQILNRARSSGPGAALAESACVSAFGSS